MLAAVIIASATFLLMILSILFMPKLKISKRISIDTYPVVAVAGLVVLLVAGLADVELILESLVADSAINPLKILVLFICMTVLSVFLDELGFFKYFASVTLKRAGASQFKLFSYLYLIVSVLTVFTSNDVIILSFTPFICYFCRRAKINAMPYLAAEFVAANTWSMALIIGNPTNIYLATAYGVDFVSYVKVMALPTLAAGVTAFILLYITFGKSLKTPVGGSSLGTDGNAQLHERVEIKDKVSLVIGVIHLCACTVLLAVGSYIGLEMWLVSLVAAISLYLCVGVASALRRKKPVALVKTLARAPWQLVPFIISMFSIIIVLESYGVTGYIARFLGESLPALKYGGASFFMANLLNNIPMSVIFSGIVQSAAPAVRLCAMYATVVGSNLGALFTPIGALAGIMWSSILSDHHMKADYLSFLKMGVFIALPTLVITLLVLGLVI